jgi:hypothetical protein
MPPKYQMVLGERARGTRLRAAEHWGPIQPTARFVTPVVYDRKSPDPIASANAGQRSVIGPRGRGQRSSGHEANLCGVDGKNEVALVL